MIRLAAMPGLLALAALWLAACSSAPTHFYTLSGTASNEPSADHQAAFVVSLQPVDVPAQVDQPQLVVRVGPDQVVPMEFQRWAAPLGDEIRNALSDDITQALDTRDVYSVAAPPNVPVYHISVHVQRFDSVVDHYALIEAAWSIRPAGPHTSHISCSSREKVTVDNGFSGLIAGHQRALKQLGDAISQTLRSITTNKSAAACPS